MRLHSLEATAFGPFADTVHIDFDRLSAAGLFLLSGPTGAGKTSVLDAVCFALYGDVPGDRSSAKRLRCDGAAPGVAPQVELEATLGGRRFRIVRSPAWDRPKKRGTGTTTQQASVTLSELVDGAWVPLSSRLDETGHLVSELLGMNLAQFTQVAMLPQGRFQAFLRAKSEERHELLQRLFRTGRFADVERWLRDRRLDLRRRSESAHQGVADLASRVSEVVGAPPPWDVRDLTEPAGDGSLLSWAGELTDAASSSAATAATEATAAGSVEADARHALEAGRALAERRARLDAAAEEHRRLLAEADAVEQDRAVLEAARRAAGVAPVLRLVDQARSARDTAARAVTHDDRDALVTELDTAVGAAARVEALRPRATRLATLRAEAGRLATRSAELERLTSAARARCEAVEVQAALDTVAERIAAHATVARLRSDLAAAREAWHESREVTLAAREHAVDVRRARLDSMAAELAGALAVGACCPVCGSDDHPAKAVAGPDAPDEHAEKAAQRAVDDAATLEHLQDGKVRDLVIRLEHAVDAAGPGDTAALEAERAELARSLERLLASAGGRPAPDAATASRAVEELVAEYASVEATSRSLADETEHLADELEEALADAAEYTTGDATADLGRLLRRHRTAERECRAALEALDRLAEAERVLTETEAALAEAVAAAGFATAADASAALRDAAACTRLELRLARHEQRLAAVTEVLRAPGSEELAATAPPDVDALVAAHRAALAALHDARATEDRWTTRAGRLASLRASLAEALDDWAPLRAELELATRLCAFVEGKSADNRLQMRLSAYVLAYRLSQVVAAANERLARMSDSRYSLEHTGRRGAGETRGGLSLQVRDDWSGEARDPATLSGGETFVVSLALALGLADVITNEVGGAALDTLFVDEGFGSLDADTLDDVMDTLDSLRDGGRVVGVVSHVAEMRDRIPTQLLVAKSRHGSTVSLTG
ncbi:AAA family ATPase [Nocardioides sp. zg-579]|uniref:Nuclease SbcCD subunit C n=1 Tax=Nocardioides marmotae TaxID=2663857 RepID=A0A6I3IZA8_9ACTN|nr:SMC family ATPase [Nocardioides marmotae]MCR6030802.1 AAA family ATPase [Gordonia jinghuaiqii]MTB94437.1 AAA family ATPase [Nocardioides marmotae]QKE01541.1 SMC family ATPase [Nocardioides marmotae]